MAQGETKLLLLLEWMRTSCNSGNWLYICTLRNLVRVIGFHSDSEILAWRSFVKREQLAVFVYATLNPTYDLFPTFVLRHFLYQALIFLNPPKYGFLIQPSCLYHLKFLCFNFTRSVHSLCYKFCVEVLTFCGLYKPLNNILNWLLTNVSFYVQLICKITKIRKKK